ncbi:T-cell surface glycoprotein CD3 epsilon chain [Carettochelys insculpta]|uniref:T-cell surface glycoprotein CD3 epsilon chain n=1 Tax=Carettochelys insculpta TaxID=44489 RepID=UPI003EBF56AC
MKLEFSLLVLGLLLCAAETGAQESETGAQEPFQVEISKERVTLTCPFSSGLKWKKDKADMKQYENEREIEIAKYESPTNDGVYTCDDSSSLQLYLKAKVCPNCEELSVLTVAGIIIADLLITLGVLVLVYYFSKNRKGQVGGRAGVHPRGQKMKRPPPVPNPDYEPIRKGQREVYAGLEPRGF